MAMWRSGAGQNMSNRRPMTSAPMNNNPMGVQQSMQPTMPDGPTTPSRASLPTNSYMRQPISSPSRAMLPQGNPFMKRPVGQLNPAEAMQAPSMKTALAQNSTWVNPAAHKSYDGPRINPFFKPQGRDPNNPSQFAIRNIQPGGGNFVDRGGQTQPRLDTSMARNVMAGQPESGSANFGQPMNVPGATQTFNGQVVSPPQRYGQEGVIPGAFRGMTPAEGDMHGMSPDAFRVVTGGQPMIPYVPSGVQPTEQPDDSIRIEKEIHPWIKEYNEVKEQDEGNSGFGKYGQASRQATIANRNARARGVRGSDVAQWRATNPMALMQKEAVANEAIINNSKTSGNPFNQTPQETPTSGNPFNQTPQVRFDGLQEKDAALGAARRAQFWRWIVRNASFPHYDSKPSY